MQPTDYQACQRVLTEGSDISEEQGSYCESSVDGVVGDDSGVSAGLSQSVWAGGFDENHIRLQFSCPQRLDALTIKQHIWGYCTNPLMHYFLLFKLTLA